MSCNHAPRSSELNEILSFTYPKLYTGACWYVGFYAFDPALGQMRRKRIKVNNVGSVSQMKKFSAQLCAKLSARLEKGWNPWIESNPDKTYRYFTEALDHYRNWITKMLNDGLLRKSTHHDYTCFARIMQRWNEQNRIPITYIYQFDREFCTEFLDYVYIDRKNTPRTRNNYLIFLKSFSTFLVQHSYLKSKPTEGIQSFSKSKLKKERTIIPERDIARLHDWLQANNRPFLLVCYFLHYMLIRPKEIAMLKLSNINVHKQTIFIPDTVSKNRKSAVVTMPAKIIHLMIDLGYFDCPHDWYIFSKGFRPGKEWTDEKRYRDYWSHHIRPALRFPKEYKFYSLKDTGITAMLRSGCDALSVKEQARHSSLLMTDIYTPQDIKDANPILLNYQGIL